MFHQNIAGILNKNEIFELTITELSKSLGRNINFICLTETFMKKGTECNLQLQGFKLASCYCRNEQRRGGSCILIKNNIDYSPLLIANQLACCYNFECCGIEIPSYNLIIVCIYRIPKSNIKIFFDKLSLLLNKVTKNNKKHIIICGD